MRAILLDDQANLRFEPDHTSARQPHNEVSVQVIQSGICETDLQLVQGYMGFQGVLGHEFVGVATAGKWEGRRVVGEINCCCHRCAVCRRGDGNHCPHRTVLGILNRDGAFAERLTLPEENLHAVPDSLSDDEAVFAEPVAAAFEIPKQVAIRPGQTACVLGDGRLGNLSAQVLMSLEADVTVVGKHRAKLSRPELGSAKRVLLDELDAAFDKAFELVVDCTGSESGLETAIRLVRPRGTVVLKTTVVAPHQLSLAPIVIDEITLVGSRCGPFDQALDALAAQRVDVSAMLSARYPLEQFEEAFQHAQRPDAMKVVFDLT